MFHFTADKKSPKRYVQCRCAFTQTQRVSGLHAGHAMEWNGRRILVWNMEDAQNEMEDLKNGMEDRLPCFHTNYIYSIYQNLQLRSTTKLE